MFSDLSMDLNYQWIKDDAGALEANFIAPLAKALGITAFVETGTYFGDTIASMEPFFDVLISIELSADFVTASRTRFAKSTKISIIQGDSASGLPWALQQIGEQPALVWLDAHYSGGKTARGESNTPVADELSVLLNMRAAKDVILIDDIRYFWPVPEHGFLTHEAVLGYPLLNSVADRLVLASYSIFVFGDALLAIPNVLADRVSASDVLKACTISRLVPPGAPLDVQAASVIKASKGEQRAALASVPPMLMHQIQYGLGGHYFLWRGLVRHAEGDNEATRSDLLLAQRCGVAVPAGLVQEP